MGTETEETRIKVLFVSFVIAFVGFMGMVSLLLYASYLDLTQYTEFMSGLSGECIKVSYPPAKEKELRLLTAAGTSGSGNQEVYSQSGGQGFLVSYDGNEYGDVALLPLDSENAGSSMIPTAGNGHTIAYYKPESEKYIQIGDIIVYFKDNRPIAHRVVAIGNDDFGWYALTKGDNYTVGTEKVRFVHIQGIVLAIIY